MTLLWKHWLLVLLKLEGVHVGETDASSRDVFTCDAGAFFAGEPGKVTCHLGADIGNSSYHFEIVRYPFKADNSHGDDVLRCHRVLGSLYCKTRSGFVYKGIQEHNLTVVIPKITEEFAGKYACQLIPSNGRENRLCDLHVKSEKNSSTHRYEEGDSVSTTVWVLVPISLVLLLVGVFITLLARRLRKTLLCRTKITENSTEYIRADSASSPLVGGRNNHMSASKTVDPEDVKKDAITTTTFTTSESVPTAKVHTETSITLRRQ